MWSINLAFGVFSVKYMDAKTIFFTEEFPDLIFGVIKAQVTSNSVGTVIMFGLSSVM